MSEPQEQSLAKIDQLTGAGHDTLRLIGAKCKALMHGYHARWAGSRWTTLEVERMFHLPIVNPSTAAISRTFTQAGKCDAIAEFEGRLYLVEHKTTSEDIADAGATFWKRLAIDSQVSAYVLANWQSGRKLDGTLYDVIRKPTIRPKQITKADQKILIRDGLYCGYEVPQDQRHATEESPELYGIRLTADCLENPGKYFQRRSVPRTDIETLEYATELWDIGKSILHARNNDAHFRNSSACMTWGSPCEYLGICSGYDSEESDRWERRADVHEELPELLDGRDVLTNSRIKCFQTCRRKHYFRYELGLKRFNEEEREALVMGSVFHEALAQWWSLQKGE
jgi:hypothetical protein